MNAKDSPHHHDRPANDPHEAGQASESWERQKLRELGLDGIEEDASTFCFHCRRDMLDRLARAQARGSVLFDMVRRHGLSPLPPRGVRPRGGGCAGFLSELACDLGAIAPRGRRALWIVFAGLATGALALWAALAGLSH
ncbi:hypothetical protein [Sorangium sp. So ce1078]|uniref:hypothetical protein n=1 Tax=Sorangium sp. So ce1078 TaxID=3133329 RepID=UPI003F5D8658